MVKPMDCQSIYKAEKRRAIRSIWIVGCLSLVSSALILAVPLYLAQVYSRVLVSRSTETLIALTAIVVFLLITWGTLEWLKQILFNRIAAAFEIGVSGVVMAGELSLPDSFLSRSLGWVAEIRRVIVSPAFSSLFEIPLVFFYLAIVYVIHPVLAGIVTAGIVALLSLAILGEWINAAAIKSLQDDSSKTVKTLGTISEQQETIRASGTYREAVDLWGRSYEPQITASLRIQRRGAALGSASKTVRQIIQIAIIGGGAALVLADQATAGVIFACSLIGARALAPIEATVSGWAGLRRAYNSLVALNARAKQYTLRDNRTPLPKPSHRLSAEKIFYTPKGARKPVLVSVSGSIPAGTILAIVGPNGSGKSTFARILSGALSPSAGRVLLDGHDIASWDPVDRGRWIGYMPQRVTFLEGTVRENIARMSRLDDPAIAVAAAQAVGVHDMIMSLPQGYDTEIRGDGFQPSGGQAQLIGLARAYYGDPAFVILDEPNANLDADGDTILAQAILNAKSRGVATIVITQRPSILNQADNVLVLKNGQVDKYGTVREVFPQRVAPVPNRKQEP